MQTMMSSLHLELDQLDHALQDYWKYCCSSDRQERQRVFDQADEAVGELLLWFREPGSTNLDADLAPAPLKEACEIFWFFNAYEADFTEWEDTLRSLGRAIEQEHRVRALVAAGMTRVAAEAEIWPSA